MATGEPAREAGMEVGFGGQVVERTEPEQARTAELVGLAVAVAVLLVAFGSVIAMGAPLLGALLGVGVGMLLIGLLASVMEVMSLAPTMASMIGIAVGIDYALFVVTRHRQHLAFGHPVVESVALAIHSAGRSVVFAGVTVVISMLGLTLVGIPLIASMGVAVAITVTVAVVVAITFLPALLGLIGTNIDRLRTPGSGSEQRSTRSRRPLGAPAGLEASHGTLASPRRRDPALHPRHPGGQPPAPAWPSPGLPATHRSISSRRGLREERTPRCSS
ncbi:MAG: MMPL family transporter [Acidimicrobiia bacterium]|nr:MMPL family transporter [Acidimicrobiia bacterium]